jgi:hypothetical protein
MELAGKHGFTAIRVKTSVADTTTGKSQINGGI